MEAIFIASSLVSVVGAVILVTQKNAVYSLIGLLIAFGGTAGVYLSLDAAFVAVSQILIYAGALAVLFLFVLMFTDTRTQVDLEGLPKAVGSRAVFDPQKDGVKKKEDAGSIFDSILLPKPMALVVSLSFFVCFAFAVFALPGEFHSFGELPADSDFGSPQMISRSIFEQFPLAFEVVSLLIFAAVLGAVLLARRHLEPFELGGKDKPKTDGGHDA